VYEITDKLFIYLSSAITAVISTYHYA